VIVDLQNDFADPEGGLSVHGGANVVPIVNGEIAMARSAEATIVFTQDWHPETTPHFAKDGGIWPVHCVAGTWGADLHPDIDPEAAAVAPRVRKGANGEDGYSGFTMRDPTTGETTPTELEALLRDATVERVVVCGLATDYCVKATALDAARLGFETAVLLDAMRPVELEPGDEQRAIEEMNAAGVHSWSTRMR
jgi:nicotinamidase/pyrazinamidase